MTFPDDLAEAVEKYVQSQEAPPSLTSVVQAAVRQYLEERGFLNGRKILRISSSKHGSGRKNISQEHDLFLSGLRK